MRASGASIAHARRAAKLILSVPGDSITSSRLVFRFAHFSTQCAESVPCLSVARYVG